MRTMLLAALALSWIGLPAHAEDSYVTSRDHIMCTTQEMLREAMQAIRDKNREQLRTVQGCRQSVDGVPVEVLQDNVSMIKIRVGWPQEEHKAEYWTWPETIKPANGR